MKSTKEKLARAVGIDRNHWDVPIRVRLRPYVRFSSSLKRQLQTLLDRWQHTAAPRAFGQRPKWR